MEDTISPWGSVLYSEDHCCDSEVTTAMLGSQGKWHLCLSYSSQCILFYGGTIHLVLKCFSEENGFISSCKFVVSLGRGEFRVFLYHYLEPSSFIRLLHIYLYIHFSIYFFQDYWWQGAWVAQLMKRLLSAQIMILGSWDGAPCWAPCSVGSLLLPLLSLSLSHSLSVLNK